MTARTHYFYQEWSDNYGWTANGYGYFWSLDQCRENAIARKAISPRSKLRIVKETREVWDWRERARCK